MGTVTVGGQLLVFGYSVITGIILSVIYDIFKAIRKVLRHGKAKIFFEDILFSIIALIITACFALLFTKGRTRGYVILGEAVGFIAVRLILSKFEVALFVKIIRIIRRILRIITLPFVFLFDKVDLLLKKIAKFIIKPPFFRKKHLERQ